MTTTTTEIKHDPTIKQQITKALESMLYTPVEKRFARRLEQLASQNMALGGYTHLSFMFKNQLYNCDPNTQPPRKANRLAPQLEGAMKAYLAEKMHIDWEEKPYVMGFVTRVLNLTNHLPDILKILPESTHHQLKELAVPCGCDKCVASVSTPSLLVQRLDEIRDEQAEAIQLMKRRMMGNLIIS